MPASLTINDTFPNLSGVATQDTDNFDLYKHIGKDSWALLFLHPGDFTPVCTTELGEAAKRAAEFEKRNVKLVGFSCNDAASHKAWIKDITAATGGTVTFPMMADPDRSHATKLGLLDESNKNAAGLPLTVRSCFVLKPDKTIACVITYPASTGRSFDELIRVVDSLQRTVKHKVATPVDWQPGQDVIVNFPLDNAAADKEFGKGQYKIVQVPSEQGKTDLKKNYLRTVADPAAEKMTCSIL